MANKNDPIWKNFLDVVILPPPKVRNYAIELSVKLHERGTPWKLEVVRRKPHLSLHHFPTDPGFVSFPDRIVAQLTGQFPGGDIQLTSISSPRHGAIFLNTSRPDWLTNAAHATSVIVRNREMAIKDDRFMERWRQMELTPRMEASIEKWGSPLMAADFIPHFTLGVLQDKERAQEIAASLSFKPMAWKVDKLHVVQIGDGWTAWEVLAEIPLAQEE